MATPRPPSSSVEPNVGSRPRSPSIAEEQDISAKRRVSDLILANEIPWLDPETTSRANFADEMIDTARYFLQHALVTTIFLMRLFALPLIYLVQQLAWPQDKSWLAAVSFPFPQDRGWETRRPSSTQRTHHITLPSLASIITLPFRMTRDLYRISNLLQRDPEALNRIGSRHRRISEVFELRDFKRRNVKILPGASTHNLVGAPAPSEVYHAALSERGDLDEVLAAFDCSTNPESAKSVKDDLTPPDTAKWDQLGSVQGTPPEMIQQVEQTGSSPLVPPVKIIRLHPEGFACFDSVSQSNRDSAAAPSTDSVAYTPKVWDRLARMEDDQRHMSLPDECMGHDIKELLGETDRLERCPTYVRRHRQSLLPGRLGTKSAMNLNSGMSNISQEGASVSQNLAPKKGGKLQKKRPDPMLANKSSMTSLLRRETFENIYLDLSKQPGRFRLSESGLGWKPSGGSEPFTLAGDQIGAAQWSRGSKGYELKLITREGDVIQLDGFELEDFERTVKAFKLWYGQTVEHKEHALRGWNWGKAEFGRAELAFNVQNRPAFEIPYSEIANTNQAGKNEIAVEFNLDAVEAKNGADGNGEKAGHTKNRGRKAAAARDELVEMRFYIPGKVSRKEPVDGGDEARGSDADDDDEGVEEQDAAKAFYETLMDKAEIGEVAGQTFATFLDILHLTPRGRFDIDMYEESFRLRGKTYDYKVQYASIKKFFILPKNDDIHTLLVLGLDPPLRQGQTRYAFVVMQLKNDDEVNLDLNMTDELLHSKYAGKLDSHYEAPIHSVIARVFKGLSGKRIIQVSKDFNSHHGASGVKCSIKANEGSLYCLEKSFLFVPKPATYVQIDSIAMITMSRVGGALAASRTFDITMTLKNGAGDHQFSNINREEQTPLEDFFKVKGIRFKNEMLDDSASLLKAALDPEDLASSDEVEAGGADRGSADEDDESPDEDFQEDSESDVAEEYDSAHESSGGSDVEMEEGNDADGGKKGGREEDVVERPKKKVKTAA